MAYSIRIDEIGLTHGKLTVIEFSHLSKSNMAYWLCRCSCGKDVIVAGGNLRNNKTRSCGCLRLENKKNETHGETGSRLYIIWKGMKARCFNIKNSRYCDYGGRGITVCERWLDFDNFKDDMIEGYRDNLTLDRNEVNENYEKGNCRWATMVEQNRNKRNTFYFEINGINKPLMEWSEILGIKYATLYARIKKGYDINSILAAVE